MALALMLSLAVGSARYGVATSADRVDLSLAANQLKAAAGFAEAGS